MPANYARFLTGKHRTVAANRQLGFALAFVAGSLNAGGFLAVQQYTSHVTGTVSAMADNLVLGNVALVWDGLAGVVSFLLGAMGCALLVNYARRHRLSSEFALPLMLEAALILCFGLLGPWLSHFQGVLVPFTVVLLCFIMGLQNAVVTKLSHNVIRTTHLTGTVTDLGIELGKLLYWNRRPDAPEPVRADRQRLKVLLGLLASFSVGGVLGAYGFKHLGYASTVPLALLLALVAIVPTLDDLLKRKLS